MKDKKFIGIKICAIIFLVFFAFLYFSQTTKNTLAYNNSEHNSNLTLSPQYPSPGKTVTARFSAPRLDMSTALITWRINGKVIQQAYGKKSVRFSVGEIGTTYKISVFAKDVKGRTASKSKTIQISDAVILWEGDTYTPPFYKGRSLQTPESSLRLMAVPSVTKTNGTLYDKKDLFYEWMLNNSNIPEIVGRGKYYAKLTNPKPFENFSVTLKIKDPNGKVRTVKSIVIPMTHPEILFYEDSPYVGIRYDKAISSTYGIHSKEATILAEPFYVSATDRFDKNLDYIWTVSGKKYYNKGIITLGADGGYGNTKLKLSIQHAIKWLQNAQKTIKVEFGQKKQYDWETNNNPNTTPL